MLYYFVVSYREKVKMASGVDTLSPEQVTSDETGPSGSTVSVQYFCHECDKKFTCDEKNETDDVSGGLKPLFNIIVMKFTVFNRTESAQLVAQSLLNDWKPQTIGIVHCSRNVR